MNEGNLRRAVKEFLDDNAATFMDGITLNGMQRVLGPAALSRFAAPVTYPFCGVVVERAWLVSRVSGNTIIGKWRYEVSIDFADPALIQVEDETQFETMDIGFRLMCDRVVEKLVATPKLGYDESWYEILYESENPVTKSNEDHVLQGPDATIEDLQFGCVIRFEVEEC